METTLTTACDAAEELKRTAGGLRAAATVLDVLGSMRTPPRAWVRMEVETGAGKPARVVQVVDLHPSDTAATIKMVADVADEFCTTAEFNARDVIGLDGRDAGRAYTVVQADVDIDGTAVRLRAKLFDDGLRARARELWGGHTVRAFPLADRPAATSESEAQA